MQVVIAEDAALLREGLTRLLEDRGHSVCAAVSDGDGLLAAVAAHRPDVAVVDIRMPPTHTDEGLRAALALRQEFPGTGVLVFSQYIETSYSAQLLEGGAAGVGYLLKDRVANVAEFAAALQRVADGGTALDPEVVSQLFRASRQRGGLSTLTPRERQVLALMAEGRSNAGIAAELVVSGGAVEKHVASIFSKLGLPPGESDNRRVLAVLRYLNPPALPGQPGAAEAAADHGQVNPVPRLAVEEGPDAPGEVGSLIGGERDHAAVRAEQAGQLFRGHRHGVLDREALGRGHRRAGRELDHPAASAIRLRLVSLASLARERVELGHPRYPHVPGVPQDAEPAAHAQHPGDLGHGQPGIEPVPGRGDYYRVHGRVGERDVLTAPGQVLRLRTPGRQHGTHPLIRLDRDDPLRPADEFPGHDPRPGREIEHRPRLGRNEPVQGLRRRGRTVTVVISGHRPKGKPAGLAIGHLRRLPLNCGRAPGAGRRAAPGGASRPRSA
jgi:DNA-binding NarL/FixJ family response regulator